MLPQSAYFIARARELTGLAVTRRRLVVAAGVGVLVTLALRLIWAHPGLEAHDHQTGDLRAAWQATRLAGEHPTLALVTIGEEIMNGERVRSPIRRSLVAKLIEHVAHARPKAIGLDIIIDQPGDGDATLAAAISAASAAGVPVVLGTVATSSDVVLPPERLAAQAAFVARAGNPPTGHIHVRSERDGVVRARATEGVGAAPSFAAALAKAAGVAPANLERLSDPSTARRIVWLAPPSSGAISPFLTVPAEALLAAGSATGTSAHVDRLLAGRIVIIGTNLDAVDRHRTPLSPPDQTVAGAVIHAQLTAQIVDGRFLKLLPETLAYVLTFFTACVGVLLGWSMIRADVLLSFVLLGPYLLLDHLLVTRASLVVPFLIPLLAWGGGILTGEAMRIADVAWGRVRRRNVVVMARPGRS